MTKEAIFSLKLEAGLRAEFLAEAASEDRPASRVMRELMRGYIAQRRQDREYDDYLQRKVDAGRASMRMSHGRPNAEVEAEFAAKRDQVPADPA